MKLAKENLERLQKKLLKSKIEFDLFDGATYVRIRSFKAGICNEADVCPDIPLSYLNYGAEATYKLFSDISVHGPFCVSRVIVRKDFKTLKKEDSKKEYSSHECLSVYVMDRTQGRRNKKTEVSPKTKRKLKVKKGVK